MGVPKFFRYISERYPCLSELAREQCIPEFDNLYLDMNGIIHTCSHPDDSNFHFNITEETMFKDIFNYIDKLFFLIKPQTLFFMAVDGVAPRAKMNQQRSRRFRSAKDAELLEEKAKSRGEVREHERFDSNCITPGTEFMTRLHEALCYFVTSKISSDPMWQKCRIILSGHDAPGEGEHKIMDYIRYLKSQKDYNPNTRHCLYGLDADLIILGLCTHELHFVVLREEVKFGRKTKQTSVEQTRFFLLHLGLLREYLEMEFDALKELNDDFDIANLIDDWVLMGFLVGNDFIPHLPCMHISSNALPLLYKTYIKVYPQLGGNINEHGKLNLERLEKYFAALANVEFEIFQENHADLKYFEAKQTKNGIDEAFDFDTSEITNENADADLADLIESSRQFLEDDNDNLSDEEQHIADEFETYKRNYYMNKLNQNDMNSESKREQAIGYITALQWILDYYYRGVQSWDWYYPHHYAPFISDLTNFKDYKIMFNLGKPFLPFQQLLAVLPAASKDLLPSAYRDLMTSPTSELLQFYPQSFETDLNGKRHEWEAVVLIPFIDEKVLLHAMKACEVNLTPTEIKRNRHGPMLQYDYTPESQGSMPGIFSMKPLYNVFCTERKIWSEEIAVPSDKTMCVELANAARTVFFPGFPTMKHLKYTFELRFARIRVFEQPSRNENLILKPDNRKGFDDVFSVAEKFLNQIVYTGWPHLIKAKIVAISCKDKYIDTNGIRDMDPKLFQFHVKTAQEHLTTRMGIEFDDFSVMVHVRIHTGSTYTCGNQGKIIVNDAWGHAVTVYPAQGVVSEIAVKKNLMLQPKRVENLFPVNSTVFFVGSPYFGSEGSVLNPLLVYECGRLKVNITVLPEPDFSAVRDLQHRLERDYVNSFQAAATIGVQMKCLGRVTGTVLVIAGARRSELTENLSKINIGLQFKFPKQQEERTGYCRRINSQWYYSSKAITLIRRYFEEFPMVFDYLSRSSERNEYCFEEDLFPEEVGEHKVEEIVAWLKTQEHIQADKRACGSQTMEKEAVQGVLDAIEQLKTLPVKTVKLQVKPHLLLKPDITIPDIYKAKRPVILFDRVVVVRNTYMVPLGAKGTVVGIYPITDPNPVRLECVKSVHYSYEVLFDKPLSNGNDIYGIALANERVCSVPESSLLVITSQDNEMQNANPNQYTRDATLMANHNNNGFQSRAKQQQQQQIQQAVSDSICDRPSGSNNTKMVILRHQQEEQMRIAPGPTIPAQTDPKREKGGDNTSIQAVAHDDFWMPAAETKVKHTFAHETCHVNGKSNISNENKSTNQTSHSTKIAVTPRNITPKQSVLRAPDRVENYKLSNHARPTQQQSPTVRGLTTPPTPINNGGSNSLHLSMTSTPNSAAMHNASVAGKSECQAETQALKSLLGLGICNTTHRQGQNYNTSAVPIAVQPTKKQLPQPPAGWRSDAQQAQQQPRNNFQTYQTTNIPLQPALTLNHQHPPTPPSTLLNCGSVNMVAMPAPQYTNISDFYQQRPQAPPPFPAQFHMAQLTGCVSRCAPTDGLSQKSAFIPLQALRWSPHQQPQPNLQSCAHFQQGLPPAPQYHQQIRPMKRTNVPLMCSANADVQYLQRNLNNVKPEAPDVTQSPQPEQQVTPILATAATVSGTTTIAELKRKRPPRVPKIGARFDNTN